MIKERIARRMTVAEGWRFLPSGVLFPAMRSSLRQIPAIAFLPLNGAAAGDESFPPGDEINFRSPYVNNTSPAHHRQDTFSPALLAGCV